MKSTRFHIHLSIHLDVLTPLKVLILSFQRQIHDPIVAVKRIKEFNWTMAKLQVQTDSSPKVVIVVPYRT